MRVHRPRFAPSWKTASWGGPCLWRLAIACAGVSCLACSTVTDTVAVGNLQASGDPGAEGPGGGGVVPDVECGDSYPRLPGPGDTGRNVCTPELARARMSQALCSCGDLGTFGGLRTDAFDSGTQALALGAAAVGINGEYRSPAPISAAGSLTIAAPTVLLIPLLDVHGDLRLGGALNVAGPLTVSRDAWFAEEAKALTLVGIGRDVHQVPGKPLDESIPPGIKGQLIYEQFSVAPPCPCDEGQVTDWSGVIASASEQNDNATVGLAPERLLQPTEAVALTLPCGRFYLSGIGGAQEVTLTVVGRVALFVDGDVLGSGPLRIQLAAGAELDWFIGGRIDLNNALQIGDAARPAAVRIYVAGDGQLSVPRESVFANIYAPRADVALLGRADFYGSIFGHTVSSVKDIAVHYDAAVQRAGDGCALEDATSCSGCGECSGGMACVNGTCGACAADTDCCWPLTCDGGRCVAFRE